MINFARVRVINEVTLETLVIKFTMALLFVKKNICQGSKYLKMINRRFLIVKFLIWSNNSKVFVDSSIKNANSHMDCFSLQNC